MLILFLALLIFIIISICKPKESFYAMNGPAKHAYIKCCRKNGCKGFLNKKWNLECLTKLGLTLPCAEIWYYNSKNTRKKCLKPCLRDWNQPYNVPSESACPNCTLNSCLQCDETKSGPIFKKVAARTRRDSGLSSAIWRPPSSIANITHYYY